MCAQTDPAASHRLGAAEHLPPAYPERAPWGTAPRLRAWQEEALGQYLESAPRDYFVAATPGAGKTTFALRLAAGLKARGVVSRITIVAPTEHLKLQWADAGARAGLRITPFFRNADGASYGSQFVGAVVTYAQVAMKPVLHRRITEATDTLVILDEVHHGGESLSWGEALRTAFDGAKRRVSLTGTPFRSDDAAIPFVRYKRVGAELMSQTDFDYGYTRALRDGVVRPVLFMIYSGKMQWQTSAGDVMQARLGHDNTRDITNQAWRTALDPAGEYMTALLSAAHRRLLEVRRSVPDAGGLVIATDHASARAYASLLAQITGKAPTLVLSDDAEASARIDAFTHSDAEWMVAVRMVSEGVDVPRLSVGVYATSASTPLFFAQAVGRFVRSRRRGETATLFLPNVPQLVELAHQLERERDHVLSVSDAGEQSAAEVWQVLPNTTEAENVEPLGQFEALHSDAHFDRVIFDAAEFGEYADVGSDEERDFLGLPGVLDHDQIRAVLEHRAERQRRAVRKGDAQVPLQGEPSTPSALPEQQIHRTLREQRRLLNSLVHLAARAQGEAHSNVHIRLRRACGGPAVSQATVEQLQQRINFLRRELNG